MSRHVFRFTLVLAIVAFIMMIVSGVGLAKSEANCAQICITGPQAVEVYPLPLSYLGREMSAPLLPQSAKAYNGITRQYFKRLIRITENICKSAHNLYNGISPSYTGYSVQLTRFNTVRQLLNRLLKRYNMGYAPDIEDFSEVTVITFTLSYGWHKLKGGLNGEGISGPEVETWFSPTACVFKAV